MVAVVVVIGCWILLTAPTAGRGRDEYALKLRKWPRTGSCSGEEALALSSSTKADSIALRSSCAEGSRSLPLGGKGAATGTDRVSMRRSRNWLNRRSTVHTFEEESTQRTVKSSALAVGSSTDTDKRTEELSMMFQFSVFSRCLNEQPSFASIANIACAAWMANRHC